MLLHRVLSLLVLPTACLSFFPIPAGTDDKIVPALRQAAQDAESAIATFNAAHTMDPEYQSIEALSKKKQIVREVNSRRINMDWMFSVRLVHAEDIPKLPHHLQSYAVSYDEAVRDIIDAHGCPVEWVFRFGQRTDSSDAEKARTRAWNKRFGAQLGATITIMPRETGKQNQRGEL